jgi:hypothetical protein
MQHRKEIRNKHLEAGAEFGYALGQIGPGFVAPSNLDFGSGVTGFGGPIGNHLFAPHGSSSATNKVKKAFDFDIDSQQKVKRDRKAGFSTQAQNTQTAAVTKKNISVGKKVGVLQPGANMSQMQRKPAKIKTQMNMTGPLPKHLLGPATVTNQSQGKSKHSQYFDNANEVVGQRFREHADAQ